eukprot:GEMP01041154.1.p1 GENE.GEMP01041154.1~~GEMP01041154.1.p1  ORF type:complete len:474 (+),score=90.68 GEMP01041154.1:81-1502(+)
MTVTNIRHQASNTYLRFSFEEIRLHPASVGDLDPLGHLTDAFDMLEGKPFSVNIITGRELRVDEDMTSPSTWVIYEAALTTPEEKAYQVMLNELSSEKLVFILMKEPIDIKVAGPLLIELAIRQDAVIPDEVLRELESRLPFVSDRPPGYARQALVRYFLKTGSGTREHCAEAVKFPDGAEAIAACIRKASKKGGFRAADFVGFQGYLVQHLRSPGVAAALVVLVEDDSDKVKDIQEAAIFMTQLVAEGFEVDNMLELIHWAALSSPETQELLLPKLPIFTGMIDTHRRSAQRAIIGIIFGNPTACANLRTIGLPKFQEDLETARIYELVSVMDITSRADLRSHLDEFWKLVDSDKSPELLSAVLHILGVVMVDDDDELRDEFRNRSISEGWTETTVRTVKQHPFAESVQQFGIELLTLLGTINPEGLLKSGAHVLARVASNEFPTNESIRTSKQWLTENASGSDLSVRHSWT